MDDAHLAGYAREQAVNGVKAAKQKKYPLRRSLWILLLIGAALADMTFFYTMPLRYLYPVTFDGSTDSLQMAAILFNDFDPTFTTINNETRRRVHFGMELMKNKQVKQLIVVGGNRQAGRRKGAQLMADYMVERGIAADNILVEDSSQDSISNMEQLGKMLTERDIDTIGLISSPYHLLRLQTICTPFTARFRLYSYNPADCFPPLSRNEIWFSAHYNALAYIAQAILPESFYRRIVLWIREHTEW